jgi:hypothetical protein
LFRIANLVRQSEKLQMAVRQRFHDRFDIRDVIMTGTEMVSLLFAFLNSNATVSVMHAA